MLRTTIDRLMNNRHIEIGCDVVLVAHAPAGSALESATRGILGYWPGHIHVEEIGFVADPDPGPLLQLVERLQRPTLWLVDLIGSSPARLALAAAQQQRMPSAVVSGLSLAMLLRLASHPEASLPEAVALAVEATQRATQVLLAPTQG